MFHFEFIVDGPPVSQQARRRERVRQWIAKVRSAAAQSWSPQEEPFSAPVLLNITYFYKTSFMDVDNIPKPIIDALKGLVFIDDNQVTDMACRKRNLENVLIGTPSSTLGEGLSHGVEFLYVVVEAAPDQRRIP
jgi:Holliday junction resolvase RusA-like endonuclease